MSKLGRLASNFKKSSGLSSGKNATGTGGNTERLKQLRARPKVTRKAFHEQVAKLTKKGKFTRDVKEALKDAGVLHGSVGLTRKQYEKAMGKTMLALKQKGIQMKRSAQRMVSTSNMKGDTPTVSLKPTQVKKQFKQQFTEAVKAEESKGMSKEQQDELLRQERRKAAMTQLNIREAREERGEGFQMEHAKLSAGDEGASYSADESEASASAIEGDTAASASESEKKTDKDTGTKDNNTQSTETPSSGGRGSVHLQGSAVPKQQPHNHAARVAGGGGVPQRVAGRDQNTGTPPPIPVVTTPRQHETLSFPDAQIVGSAEPGSRVTVLFEGNLFAQLRLNGVADTDGVFRIPITQAIPIGDHTVQVVAARTESNGDVGPSSAPSVPLQFSLRIGEGIGQGQETPTDLDDDLPL